MGADRFARWLAAYATPLLHGKTLHRFHDGLLQPRDSLPHVLDLMQIILARGLLSDLCEAQLRDPDQIGPRPQPAPVGGR